MAFKSAGGAVLQIGTFSNPARVEDVAGLSLDERDFESLRRCRPRDCKMQLSAEALERFRRDVPWGSTGARAAADRMMRQVLVELVNRYRESGDGALMTYADGDRPLSLSDEFRSMVASRPAILERFPQLHQHVIEFPRRSTEAIEDIDSSLGVTVLLDVSGGSGARMFMAYVNRSRLDALGGFFGGLKRTIVRSRTRSAMADSLVEARDLVEKRYRLRRELPAAQRESFFRWLALPH